MTNTKKKGIARTIILKKGLKFVAVCLDFDLFEESKDFEKVEKAIKEAIIGYVENVCKNKLADSLLNRPAPKKYWDMYYKYCESIKKPKIVGIDINKISMFTMPINSKMFCKL
ncbi:MAG: hypothetical protein WCT18_01155 [Patescibacteria group bacterium]